MNREDLWQIVWSEHPDWDTILSKQMTDRGRWTYTNEIVAIHKDQDTWVEISYETGLTEYQDLAEEDREISFRYVEPVQELVTVYKEKE